jgi:hypothetical protein
VAAVALVTVSGIGVKTALDRNAAFARLDALLRRMWGSLPAGPAIVFFDDDMVSRLRGYQILEGSRRDVEVLHPRHLTQPRPRRLFTQAPGFDPAAGVTNADLAAAHASDAGSQALTDRLIERVNEKAPEPVILFLPRIPSIRLLEKPGTDATHRP